MSLKTETPLERNYYYHLRADDSGNINNVKRNSKYNNKKMLKAGRGQTSTAKLLNGELKAQMESTNTIVSAHMHLFSYECTF